MKRGIKYLSALACITLAVSSFVDQAVQAQQNPDQDIVDLISRMSIEQKVGQMTQLNLDVISVGEVYNLIEPHSLDEAKLKNALIEKHVGSILNVGGHAYPLDHWQEFMKQIQQVATEETSLKIPILYGIDAIHGANYLMEGTLFPQPLAQAATWNPAQVERCAAVTAYETRATGVPWNFSPVLDLARQALWSRVFETYGEDVFLAKTMGNAVIRGYQGEDASDPEKVSACMKHFLGYSIPFTGKDRTPVYIHERQLREYFLPTFEAAITQGALSVMINSGELNGIPVHADHAILTELLRNELGFEGVAVTDWEDIMKLKDNHHVAATLKDAVEMAVMAGIDMSMTPNDYSFTDLLIELTHEGKVPESRLDESVFRILKMKKRLGLFKTPLSFKVHEYPLVGSVQHDDLNYETACEAITLLKNDNERLPLKKKTGKKILLTGPSAHSMVLLNGAWTRTWQGTDPKYNDESKLTILEALNERYGTDVVHVQLCTLDELDATKLKSIIARKGEFSEIIICLGELPSTEIPGNIDDLWLEAAQRDLVKGLASMQVPMTAILVENRPRVISDIGPLLDAVIMAYQPGDEGGRAITAVLSGDVNPSGKLPITYPRYPNDLITYDHKYTERLNTDFSWTAFDPQWEFGHGMGYAKIALEEIQLSKDSIQGSENITITVTVNNLSVDIDQKETVMLFIGDRVASITPPIKRLRAFKKLDLPPYGSEKVSFSISAKDLAFVGTDLDWVTESGWFDISIGDKKASFYYTAE